MSDGTNPANSLVYFSVPLLPETLAELRSRAEDVGRTAEEFASLILAVDLERRRYRERVKRAVEADNKRRFGG